MNISNVTSTTERQTRGTKIIAQPWPVRAMAWVLISLMATPSTILAGPSGARVVAGQAAIQQTLDQTTVRQLSDKAIVNWEAFSIGENETAQFLQPGAQSAILNRVLGADPSQLLGRLQANGQVFLINPNGIVVGPNGSIDTGAFFASTLDVADEDFLNGGDLRFSGLSEEAVRNLGRIRANQGDIVLIARTVKNAGALSAKKGVAAMAAGSEVLLTHEKDQRVLVLLALPSDSVTKGVENSGLVEAAQAEIKAAGGDIYDLAINQTGIIRARGVEKKGGRIILSADGGAVAHSGESSARNADGGGGEILVGGGFQGENPNVPNASMTTIAPGSLLDASAASQDGDGGKVIVWADAATRFEGVIRANAGATGGDGGFAEVSGKRYLDFRGEVELSAPGGQSGQLLLDPDSLTINDDADSGVSSFVGTTANSTLNAGTLSAMLENFGVTVRAGDNSHRDNGLIVDSDLSWNSGNNLSLLSGSFIDMNASVTAPNGRLSLGPGTWVEAFGHADNLHLDPAASIAVNALSIGGTPIPNNQGAPRGSINMEGAVSAGTLTIDTFFWSFGDIAFDNPNNSIGALRTSVDEDNGNSYVKLNAASLTLHDSGGGLSVQGDFSGIAGGIEIVTTGDLKVENDPTYNDPMAGSPVSTPTLIQSSGSADLTLAARGGTFMHLGDAGSIAANGAGRLLVYSDTLANTQPGDLTLAKVYNRDFDNDPPAGIGQTGDRLLLRQEAILTFGADSVSRTYGQGNPGFTASLLGGLQDGDTANEAFSGAASASVGAEVDASSNAGDYAIGLTMGSLAATELGYEFALMPGTLTVDPAPLTVTANNATRVYGDGDPDFSARFEGLVNDDSGSVVGDLAFSPAATMGSDVGNHALNVSGSAANYTITPVAGTLAVTPAPLSVTADNAARVFGAADPTFSAMFDGLKAGDLGSDLPGLSFAASAMRLSDVGDYSITPSGINDPNYNVGYFDGVLTVNNALLTITAQAASRAYGSGDPMFASAFEGLPDGVDASIVTGLQHSSSATAGSRVGDYTITPHGAVAPNFTIDYATGILSVTPAALKITADNAMRLYGGDDPEFAAMFEGLVNGDQPSVVSDLAFASPATVNSAVGDYALTPSGSAVNYQITPVSGTLSVTPAPLTIKANNAARVFGEPNPVLSAVIDGLVASDTQAVLMGLNLATPADAATAVGEYPITASGVVNQNYDISYADGILSIANAILSVAIENASKVYGAVLPDFVPVITGLPDGVDESIVTGLQFNTAATMGSDVGDYQVTPFGGVAENFAINYVTGELAITPAPLTITADNAARVYGGAAPDYSAMFAGLVNGDQPSVVADLAFNTPAVVDSNVGDYALNVSGSAGNYDVVHVPGTLSITPAALTISAVNAARLYGEDNPAFLAEFDGLTAGDTAMDLPPVAFSTDAERLSNVGGYAITPSGATDPNYAIGFVDGVLTVNRAALTITAQRATRVYGAANPDFESMIGGLPMGVDESVVTGLQYGAAAMDSDVGEYPLTPFGASADNFNIGYAAGVIEITPAALTISANNASRIYGGADPAFSAMFAGLVNGDLPAVVADLAFDTVAGLNSGVGDYPLTVSGSAGNYQIATVPGQLSITAASLTITADDSSRIYGQANPGFTAQIEGLVAGDASDVVTGLQLQSAAMADSNTGDYGILPSGAAAANYSIGYAPGTLTVTPAALRVAARDTSRLYGAENPVFSAEITGLVAGDGESVVNGLILASAATVDSGVGMHAITASGATAPNYDVTLVDGALQVNPAPLTIRANDASRMYFTANPEASATFSGLVAGDVSGDISGLTFEFDGVTQGSGVGMYGIAPSGAASPNYEIAFENGTLEITAAPLTIATASPDRAYGSQDPAIDIFVSSNPVGGPVNLGGLSANSDATIDSPVGEYGISITGALGDPNYNVTFDPGRLTVDPAPLTIQADNKNKVYGEENPEFTARVTGLVLAQTEDVISGLQLASSATAGTGVSTRAIVPSGATAPNYDITFVNGVLRIAPADIQIAPDNVHRLYGDANPAFDAFPLRVIGLVNGDSPSVVSAVFETTANPQSDVGIYNISILDAFANANYNIVSQGVGQLIVGPRPLTIAVNDTSRLYGDPNPAFSASFSGLRFDSPSAIPNLRFTTQAGINSGVSVFGVFVNSDPAPNYSITYEPGQMAINPAPLGINVNPASRFYGADDPVFSATVVGLKGDDTVSGLGLQFSGGAIAASPVGDYPVTVAAAFDHNYEIQTVPGFLTVEPSPVTVRALDVERVYGTPPPSIFSVVIDSLIPVAFDAIVDSVGLTAPLDLASPAGQYTILMEPRINPNFAITAESGLFTISPAPLTIEVGNVVQLAGRPVEFSADFQGLVAGDQPFTAFPNLMFEVGDDQGFGVSYDINLTGAANPNYRITVVPGTLQLPLIDSSQSEFARGLDEIIDEIQKTPPSLVVASGSLGPVNHGTVFNLAPDQLGILDEAVEFMFDQVEGVRGQGGKTGMALWMSDLASNPEKQAQLLPYFIDYAASLAGKPSSELSDTQNKFLSRIEGSVGRMRDRVAEKAQLAHDNFLEATEGQGKNMASTFKQAAWDDFAESATADISGQIVAGFTAMPVAAGVAMSGALLQSSIASVFPFAATTSQSGATTVINSFAMGGGAATGATAIVAVAVSVAIVSAVQVSKQVKKENAFEDIVARANEPVDLTGMVGSEDGQTEFKLALLALMSGN